MPHLFGRRTRPRHPVPAARPRASLLYLLLALGPSLATVMYSLTDTNGLTAKPLNFIGLANYQEFLFKSAPPPARTSTP